MGNKKAGPFRTGDQGSFRGSLLAFLAVILALAAVSFLLWRYIKAPSVTGAGPAPQTTPSHSVFQGDRAEATQRLLKALNDKLQSLDLLKLQDREVETRPATVSGQVLSTYRETFRLPLRYSSEQIVAQLSEAAKPLGARLMAPLMAKGTNFFAYNSEWTPVEIDLVQVSKPRLCLIIDDGGYQRGEALEKLYGFKVPVTVALIPDTRFSKALAEEFPGHRVEVMCHMPMEGHEKGMVGNAYQELLKKGMPSAEAEAQIQKALTGLPNCRGLNNHMGSVATADEELMDGVCRVLKSRGLFIIDSKTTARSVVEKTAKINKVAVAHRDVFLDNVETPEAILKQLDQAAALAKKNGLAVAIGHFKLTTLQTLEGAVGKLADAGIQFVYASEIVKE